MPDPLDGTTEREREREITPNMPGGASTGLSFVSQQPTTPTEAPRALRDLGSRVQGVVFRVYIECRVGLTLKGSKYLMLICVPQTCTTSAITLSPMLPNYWVLGPPGLGFSV